MDKIVLLAERDALKAKILQLQAIVDRLPKTADGVPVAPGMMVWTPDDLDDPSLVTGVTNFNASGCDCDGDGEESYHNAGDDCHWKCDRSNPANECYSTRAAAQAAGGE